MIRATALTSAAYAALTVVMSWPYVSYSNFASASYGGDARLIIWTLAWDNHAVLSGLPLFQSNLFFPAVDSLRYNEHLFGVSLFTLPWAAAGVSPVLAYNVTWWLAWILNGVATFVFLRRYVRDVQAAFVGSLAFVCSFYVMSHAHGHLHLIWMWPLPLSALLLERWFDAPAWRRLALWAVVFVLGALTSWYVAVMMLMVNGIAGLTFALCNDPSLDTAQADLKVRPTYTRLEEAPDSSDCCRHCRCRGDLSLCPTLCRSAWGPRRGGRQLRHGCLLSRAAPEHPRGPMVAGERRRQTGTDLGRADALCRMAGSGACTGRVRGTSRRAARLATGVDLPSPRRSGLPRLARAIPGSARRINVGAVCMVVGASRL